MNSRRARFIALQTLLTVVLMGVIVVTLINPKSENTLFAVDVPGGGAPVAQGPPSYQPARGGGQGHGGGEPGRAEVGPAGAATHEGAGAPSAAESAGATGATPPAPSPPPAEQTPTGPPGEQYDDTLARLSDAVN